MLRRRLLGAVGLVAGDYLTSNRGPRFRGGGPNRGGYTITNNYRNPDASRSAAGYQTLHQELASGILSRLLGQASRFFSSRLLLSAKCILSAYLTARLLATDDGQDLHVAAQHVTVTLEALLKRPLNDLRVRVRPVAES